MTMYARTERLALADLFDEAGPDAPTLCAGWTTRDLAAHLVARERRPDSGPGLLIRPLAGYAERVRRGLASGRSYAELVSLVRDGPPPWSPFGLPRVDAAVNTVEFFVHHEDVRRAGQEWRPRETDPGLEDALWRRLRAMARMLVRRVPVGVELRVEGHAPVLARSADPSVTLRGDASEVVLYLFGRRQVADVEVEGTDDAVAALAVAPLGI
ncbi:MAG: TIGR03085 family metal-binding protein [Streptosporangiaceae bacterium]